MLNYVLYYVSKALGPVWAERLWSLLTPTQWENYYSFDKERSMKNNSNTKARTTEAHMWAVIGILVVITILLIVSNLPIIDTVNAAPPLDSYDVAGQSQAYYDCRPTAMVGGQAQVAIVVKSVCEQEVALLRPTRPTTRPTEEDTTVVPPPTIVVPPIVVPPPTIEPTVPVVTPTPSPDPVPTSADKGNNGNHYGNDKPDNNCKDNSKWDTCQSGNETDTNLGATNGNAGNSNGNGNGNKKEK